jgi:hypothetical protein
VAPGAAPAFSAAAGAAPSFSLPPSAAAPAQAGAGTVARTRWIGCALFAVAAAIVIVVAVAGAVALRWWMASRGM